MALAGRVDFIMEQGARWFPDLLQWLDNDGNPRSLASYAAKMQIRLNKAASAVIEVMSSAFGDITLGGANGTIQIDMSAERTDDLTFTRAFYDLLLFLYVGSAIVAAGGYTTANIDVDAGSSRSTITADGGTPFSTLSANDYIAVTACENSASNGIYKILTVTDSDKTLTLTTVMSGSDNTDDTSISIQGLNNDTIVRFSQGYIVLDKRVTQ